MPSCSNGDNLPLFFYVSSRNVVASSCRHMELQSDATFVRAVTFPNALIDTKAHCAILQLSTHATSAALLASFCVPYLTSSPYPYASVHPGTKPSVTCV